MNTTTWIIVILVLAFGPVLISFVVEALRPVPKVPVELSWGTDIPVDYVTVGGVKLRYITLGEGPPLVLLHTLRTQLDIFQKIIPSLSRHFKIYAFDYPGHGWSDIPDVPLKPDVFFDATTGFLDALDINDAVVAGISIGGTIQELKKLFRSIHMITHRVAALKEVQPLLILFLPWPQFPCLVIR
jgi:hypothetical protein